MSSRFATRFAFVAALLIASGLAQAGEAGRIVFVTGQAHVASHAIALGDAVQEGDEITTGADGYVYVKTVDNGFLILRPATRAKVVAYHIDAQNPANTRVKFELLSGVARAISGEGVKKARQNFRFNTPVAAIGVRGTDFTVFTDQQTSRITVISGAVVVSGFSAGCGPEGAGPCEGGSSRELFAEQTGQLLQVQKGQAAPQLLRNNSLSPDLSAPPRKDEPPVKSAASDAAHAGSDVNLEPKKGSDILSGSALPPAPVTPPSPQPPVVVVPPPPPVPKPPEILWGRWKAIADLPADSAALEKLRNGNYGTGMNVEGYFINRVKDTELVLPHEGRAAFNLASSEVYIRGVGASPVVATVQDPRLDVDFAARTFATSLIATGGGARVDVHSKGDVWSTGELVGTYIGSNTTLRGYLGGAGAKEAGYIFSTNENSGPGAFGATHWAR
ncbi:MAG TPA: FecR family protein [Noviherbaspirillum sp.]|uniref:FecR family protein n=1 Tax=Noviherbaspirillum sp. TaxID=1926288 RepID=UPI002B4A2127|nr:FecR family protein [Noviherbaspirillum sp.]HJV84307.1 FecR family protein [Noviherbaspirillum sp.]